MTNPNNENLKNEVVKVEQISSSSDKKKNSPKRKNKVQPVYAVLTKARRQFERQIKQDTESKRSCILRNFGSYYGDPGKFWMDFVSEAHILLDSIRFNKACESIMLDPKYVAEHIVFEGKNIVEQVHKYGISICKENIRLYKSPIFLDTYNLYGEMAERREKADKEALNDPSTSNVSEPK